MGERLDLDKLRSIGHVSRRTGNRVREGRDAAGQRYKVTTDELGNKVRERQDGQDVKIAAPRIVSETSVREER